MQAIIMCGGRGERLMPMTACTPAGLLRMVGKPVISYALDQLKKANFTEVTLALGYLSNQVIEEFESCEYNGIKISFTSANRNGTAPALEYAMKGNDDVLVIEANCIFDFNLEEIISYHINKKSFATFVTKKEKNINEHICFATNKDDMIIEISHYPSYNNVSKTNAFTGIYILSKQVFEMYDFNHYSDVLLEIIPLMTADSNPIYVYKTEDFWHKISDSVGFIHCQREILNGKGPSNLFKDDLKDKVISQTDLNFGGVSIIPPVYIGKNVTIKTGSIIESGTVIDDNCVIESRSRINNSFIGKGSHIDTRCELTNSVICPFAKLKSSAICGEYSVVGEKAIIGENTRILDSKKVWAGKEVQANSVVSENVMVGMGKRTFIDDECAFCFGSGTSAPSDSAKFGMAVGTALDSEDFVVVGWCGGASSKALSDSFISGLLSSGVQVFDIGESTNQQVMYAVNKFSAKLGCFALVDYSEKIKLMDKGGLPLKRKTEYEIEQSYNNSNFRTLEYHDYGQRYEMFGISAVYENYLKSIIGKKFRGINIQVRTSSNRYAKIADMLFHSKNDINGEKIIFHLSADGNSCSAYHEKTGYVMHERLVLLGLKISYKKEIPVSLPFVFPMGADSLAEEENGRLYRYYNSSDTLIDNEARTVAQRTDNFFVRDGLALVCLISNYLSENILSFSNEISTIPKINSVQRYVSVDSNPNEILQTFATTKTGSSEGIIYQNEQSRALIRPLKDGHGIMIFAESFKSELASSICDDIQEKLKLNSNMSTVKNISEN